MQENPSNSVHFVEIDDDQQGQRIDNFLITYLKGVPKSRVYRILRKGEVRVNKKRIKPTYRIQAGDQVRIPPVRVADEKTPPPAKSVAWIEDAILYEDAWLLAINKPSGMAVHGGSGIRYGVIEALRALREEASRYELVHRIDRATSGVLLVAKKRSALRFLHDAIREHRIEKRYLALVKGKMRKSKTVLAPLK
ncbi:MAG: 23S rRNA pseudouridine(955/2504/2580) synthase, partial [Gammaproteobacteria bacterium]|nr:23S rRNA pseudouridine(955/2504/2580) synthase [Gammaproteobacteria bacterium]